MPKDIHNSLPPSIIHTRSQAASYNKLWHHEYHKLNAIREYSDGSNCAVCFIDNGIDINHSELKGKVRRLGKDVTGEQWTPGDHGTHVASTTIGKVRGIWPEMKAIDAKALSGISGGGPSHWLVIKLKEINKYNKEEVNNSNKPIRVLNMSIGSQELDEDVKKELSIFLMDRCNFAVIAVGNDGTANTDHNTVDWPAALVKEMRGIITVGAGEPNGSTLKVSTWSSKGKGLVSVIAPGTFIYAAAATTTKGRDRNRFMSGSSMAAPQIAGLVETLRELSLRVNGIELHQDMLFNILYATTVDIEEIGTDSSSGMGAIDILACYEYVCQSLSYAETEYSPPPSVIMTVTPCVGKLVQTNHPDQKPETPFHTSSGMAPENIIILFLIFGTLITYGLIYFLT